VAIQDIKAGQYVLSLNETSGKLQLAEVKALLDMGEKPIYELTTESGRAINTTAEHPYLVREEEDYSIFKNSLMNSSVVNILTNDCSLRCGSLDQTLHFNFNASAAKSISFLCEIESTLGNNFLYSSTGTNSIKIANSLNRSLNSFLEIPVFLDISSEFLLISSNANSGAKNSKSWSTNIPLVNESFQKKVNNTFESTTNFIYIKPFDFNSSYLPYLDALCNLTDQSIISFSSCKCFNNLRINKDNFIPEISTWFFNSAGTSTLIVTSAIDKDNQEEYLKLSEWTKVSELEEGDSIAVPDYETGEVKWEMIKEIKQHSSQHVYDLAIEGTHNFIANDIVAHNTYLGNSTADTVTIAGNVSVNTDTLFVDSTNNNVGIGTTAPTEKLTVVGNISATTQLISTQAIGTAPFIVTSPTKVANLNADLLDGMDSSAFGDATAANQDTILTKIGANTDAANMSDSLFAGQQYLWDNRPLPRVQTLTSSGTWTRPANVNMVWVTMVGGGGGGGYGVGGCSTTYGAGGGAGMALIHYPYNVSGDVSVIVGARGTGGYSSCYGSNGGNSSFGTLNATGGFGGGTISPSIGGNSGGGIAGGNAAIGGNSFSNSLGDSGASGGGGSCAGTGYAGGAEPLYPGGTVSNYGGGGGASLFGKGGTGSSYTPIQNAGIGAGGGGACRLDFGGGHGGAGMVIVEWWE